VVGVCPDGGEDQGSSRSGKAYPEPTTCPSCFHPLQWVEAKGKQAKGNLWCRNPLCPAQHLESMKHFVDVCLKVSSLRRNGTGARGQIQERLMTDI